MKRIWSDYPDKDIYNADGTALYYRMLPSASMTIDDITPIAFKTRKEKVSLLLCRNMDWFDKLIPLVIGKYKKPRCFKSQSILPVKYTSNSASWMTRAISGGWLLQWNLKLARESRKVCLILDNYSCHIDLKAILKSKLSTFQKIPQHYCSHWTKRLLRQLSLLQKVNEWKNFRGDGVS